MNIDDKKMQKPINHTVIMENRGKISVSGVIDVDSFNEESIIVQTDLGVLTIKGIDLHINKLNLENSELVVEGDVTSLVYSDNGSFKTKGAGLLARLFR